MAEAVGSENLEPDSERDPAFLVMVGVVFGRAAPLGLG